TNFGTWGLANSIRAFLERLSRVCGQEQPCSWAGGARPAQEQGVCTGDARRGRAGQVTRRRPEACWPCLCYRFFPPDERAAWETRASFSASVIRWAPTKSSAAPTTQLTYAPGVFHGASQGQY